MAKILIIDDEEMMCETLSTLVERKKHQATSAMTLQEGIRLAANEDFDVVFLDVKMPDGNGLDALPTIEASPSNPEVIIMTGFGDPNGAELAIKCGAWDYVEKGFSIKEITLSLERALQYRKEKKEANEKRKPVRLKRANIIGHSPALNNCLDMVAQAAESDANVFITGETGTGKELFARAVYENSLRSEQEFVVVDCTSLPETLVESLLFGHEKGSFTGADRAQNGLIRQAHKGTLFLDEVGELPMSLQKSFLRVLQEHRFRPVGSNKEVESEFRLIAATNRDLDAMVESGEFRSDLLFRLRTFIIELPPLRERRDDIKELARYHMDKYCHQYGLDSKGFSPEFLETLVSYPWPGNVRELVNTLERSLTTARFDQTLYPKHLPSHIRVHVRRAEMEAGQAGESKGDDQHTISRSSGTLPKLQDYREEIYAQAEKEYLLELMEITADNIPEACRISGLSQSRLYALLKKNAISRKD
ncbi:two-component system, NtrC family, response regulator [Desulfuromusa kysingii]|uniref:Two-component system, NtrC family, response regulator n=1 Tax=Desulfuromusa kysingii TaxID=37625 RepID=A0A1H4AL42_9BACT|nr:sigma-54 dependent transcriptional regulator [Desulfuromusa kysingii]SEA36666.1 two-component system, NtrC family, response regulator [Desulfuromusa kysingii]